MNIITEAYIVEWESGRYVVTHDDCRGEYDRQFLLHCGSDFSVRTEMATIGIEAIPLFDTITDAETSWYVYKVFRDQYLLNLNNRKIILKNLK